jgi:hypothetical protein
MMLVAMLGVGACAGYKPFEAVQIPAREADLYPTAQTKLGITVAIDEVNNVARIKQYFGTDLRADGILPINVVVSNHGQDRVMVRPSDILMLQRQSVVDPLPIDRVAALVKRRHGSLRTETQREIDRYFAQIAFQETALAPNESRHGVLFFPYTRPEERRRQFFMVSDLFRDSSLQIRVGVTDLETRQRLRFGPFFVAGP